MVWTTFNPVEAIPWVAGKIVVHGISYPVDDDYPVDNIITIISRGCVPWTL